MCAIGRTAEQTRLDNLFKGAGLTPGYRRFELRHFDALGKWESRGKETAIAAAHSWATGAAITYEGLGMVDPGGYDNLARPSLILSGIPGVGKTALAAAAFRARLETEGAGLLIEFYDLINAIQSAYGQAGGKAAELLDAAQDAPLLMVDDLGDPDRGQSDPGHAYQNRFAETDDRRQKLYAIVNHRCARGLPTIFTTNLMPEEIQAQFGVSGRIRDRLEEMAVWIEMSGEPLRPGVTSRSQSYAR